MFWRLRVLSSEISTGARRIGLRSYLRYRLHSRLGKSAPLDVNVSGVGVKVRPGTPDLQVAFDSLGTEFELLSHLLPKSFDGIIVDAGGYIGTAAIKLSTMYPDATVVSIEPSSENFRLLKTNTEGYSNIHCIQAALFTESDAVIALSDRGTGNWGFTIAQFAEKTALPELEKVSTISLSSIMQAFENKSIGLIKLDIEGGEFALLEENSDLLQSVPAIFVELHERIVPGCEAAFFAYSADRWVVSAGGEKLLSLSKAGVPALLAGLGQPAEKMLAGGAAR